MSGSSDRLELAAHLNFGLLGKRMTPHPRFATLHLHLHSYYQAVLRPTLAHPAHELMYARSRTRRALVDFAVPSQTVPQAHGSS